MRYALAIALFSASGLATAQCGSHAVMSTTREDGTKIGIVISDAQLAHAPAWSPDKGEPPLSIAQVAKLSLTWAKDNYKRFDSVQIHSIDLSEVGCTPGKHQWYYRVEFVPIIDGSRVYSGGHFVGVLMDGTVIGPTQLKNDF
jgi:hypothetical protein